MPHLVMLYTPQLDAACDIDQLCRGLADAMLSVRDEAGAQVFPTGGTRVLAYRSDHHAISDGSGDHAFMYFNLRMARGRSAAVHRGGARADGAGAGAAPGGPDAAGRRRPRSVRRQAGQPASAVREEVKTPPVRSVASRSCFAKGTP